MNYTTSEIEISLILSTEQQTRKLAEIGIPEQLQSQAKRIPFKVPLKSNNYLYSSFCAERLQRPGVSECSAKFAHDISNTLNLGPVEHYSFD